MIRVDAGVAGRIDVELEIPTGQFVAVYGESGAGKSSLLRLLAGLLLPQRGRVDRASRSTAGGAGANAEVGFVFQDYALFPHMTVRQNLAFAAHPQADSAELLALTELTDLADRRPPQLSGGQQQRVALARALVQQPALLLLDEPFAALDERLNHKLRAFVRAEHERRAMTTVLVSHQPEEILELADRVIELRQGSMVFDGAPAQRFPSEVEVIRVTTTHVIVRMNGRERMLPRP